MDKPKLENCPGHTLEERREGWAVIWQARSDLKRDGYLPKQRILAVIGPEPSELERQWLSDQCSDLQTDMLLWGRGNKKTVAKYGGTLGSLVRCYETDPDSSFQKLRYRSKENYRSFLKRIEKDHGYEQVADIKARQVLRWHEDWMKSGTAMAHGLIGMLRTILTFGATILDERECREAKVLMHDMRFTMPQARSSIITADQVIAIRAMAHKMDMPSIALAQAFQFDCMLRQRDVIGEWVPQTEPGLSDVLHEGNKWIRGLRDRKSVV
jgi:hypothetical protein